jgi:TolA-binding protein
MITARSRTAQIFVAVGTLLSVFGLGFAALNARPVKITWERDYERAIERAKAEKKLIVADLFTDWCVLCKKMDAETYANPELNKNLAEKYVWLKLNTETEEDGIRLQKEFAIFMYPTTLVLDEDGEEVDRIEQFLSATAFSEAVVSLSNNPDSLANLRKAVREQPKSAAARYALAEKILSTNNYDKAEVQFRKVVEMDPENREGKSDLSQYNIALCLASRQKFEDAIAQLQILEDRFPASSTVADAAVLRGQIYHCCGQLDKAQAALKEYAKKYPTQGHIEEVENLLAQMKADSEK